MKPDPTDKDFVLALARHTLQTADESLKKGHALDGLMAFVRGLTEEEAGFVTTLCFMAHECQMDSLAKETLEKLHMLAPTEGEH